MASFNPSLAQIEPQYFCFPLGYIRTPQMLHRTTLSEAFSLRSASYSASCCLCLFLAQTGLHSTLLRLPVNTLPHIRQGLLVSGIRLTLAFGFLFECTLLTFCSVCVTVPLGWLSIRLPPTIEGMPGKGP